MIKYLLAAVAAVAMTPAAQASVNIGCPGFAGQGYCTFDEADKTGNFGDSFTTPQAFSDRFTLTLSQAYDLSITLTKTAATGGPINFTSAVLLDSALNSLGPLAFGAVPTTFSLGAGSYTLKFDGDALSSSSYQGTIDIESVAVPAPATWGLMLVGVGLLGMAQRRRLQATRLAFS